MTTSSLPHFTFRNGLQVPLLGMGSWAMGDKQNQRKSEIESLQYGLDAGLRVIDTAEMYGNGRSEALVGDALKGRRQKAFLVSKVLPSNASYENTIRACERSLKHLQTDYLDLYLLHWRSAVPLKETVRAFEDLTKRGLIKAWGVSNFDCSDMEELDHVSANCLANQVLYSLEHRGIEYDLISWNAKKNIATMAYSPIGQGADLIQHPTLKAIAAHHETSLGPASAAQIALSWVLRHKNILAIPKAGTLEHQKQNIAALEIQLTEKDLAELERAFPPPTHKVPLAVI
ncbi:aldo/keto reductase [Aristophania vespae]|uniref:Aldo/keto reductase n=1 Tax=Aristophania vespae TaxID=2697033 RepID=A0A6P1NMY3_9PROT|nr:aldo/keto reductase [Aristophania vespae]QHI96211.1 aldo/keto reductase [Aristophania vespae]